MLRINVFVNELEVILTCFSLHLIHQYKIYKQQDRIVEYSLYERMGLWRRQGEEGKIGGVGEV